LVTVFYRPSRVLMGTHYRPGDEYFFKIRILGQLGEDSMPDTLPRPPGKALIDTIPRAELAGAVPPRRAGLGDPQHVFDKLAVIGRRASRVPSFTR